MVIHHRLGHEPEDFISRLLGTRGKLSSLKLQSLGTMFEGLASKRSMYVCTDNATAASCQLTSDLEQQRLPSTACMRITIALQVRRPTKNYVSTSASLRISPTSKI